MFKILLIGLVLLYLFKDKLESIQNIEPMYILLGVFLLYYFRKNLMERFDDSSSVRINKIVFDPCFKKPCGNGDKDEIYDKLKENHKNIQYVKTNNKVDGGKFNFYINLNTQGNVDVDYNGEYTFNKVKAFLNDHHVKRNNKIKIVLSSAMMEQHKQEFKKLKDKLNADNREFEVTNLSNNDNNVRIIMQLENNGVLTYFSNNQMKFAEDVDKIIDIISNFKSSI